MHYMSNSFSHDKLILCLTDRTSHYLLIKSAKVAVDY